MKAITHVFCVLIVVLVICAWKAGYKSGRGSADTVTPRDIFAAAALAGELNAGWGTVKSDIVDDAYRFADLMVEKRSAGGSK